MLNLAVKLLAICLNISSKLKKKLLFTYSIYNFHSFFLIKRALTTGDLNKQPKGIFYFAHTVTLQHLMAALKIAVEPTPLLASNYAEMNTRDYRTSLLGPFATNVVAVFYR